MNQARQIRELNKLETSPRSTETPEGVGIVRFIITCPSNSHLVLTKVKAVIKIVAENSGSNWPTEDSWKKKLPHWFIESCAPPMNREQAEAHLAWWKKLSTEEQKVAELTEPWSLENWIFWMSPTNRQWYWWDASIIESSGLILVAVEAECWPFAWGALRWLFQAAGATMVQPETN